MECLGLTARYFNSIKVRLEYSILKSGLAKTFLFQFHKGAIGVPASDILRPTIILFQFHKGAIGVRNEIKG